MAFHLFGNGKICVKWAKKEMEWIEKKKEKNEQQRWN